MVWLVFQRLCQPAKDEKNANPDYRSCRPTKLSAWVSKSTYSPTAHAVHSNCSDNDPILLPIGATSRPSSSPRSVSTQPASTITESVSSSPVVQMARSSSAATSGFERPDFRRRFTSHIHCLGGLPPYGTFYHQTGHDGFRCGEHRDGDFTYSIWGNHLGPGARFWDTSFNAGGWTIRMHARK